MRPKTSTGMRPHHIGVKTLRYVARAAERGRETAYEYPSINLGGLWLKKAGFKPGDTVVPEVTESGDLLLRRV